MSRLPIALLVSAISVLLPVLAHARAVDEGAASKAGTGGAVLRLVWFEEPPVLAFDGRRDAKGGWKQAPTRPRPGQRFDPESVSVKAYRQSLDELGAARLRAMAGAIGRDLRPLHRFSVASHGLAVKLDDWEAARVAELPGVAAVTVDRRERLHTDAGPAFIMAPSVWDGSAPGVAQGTLGEGVIVGVLDSGVNYDHPAFADIGGDGYNHVNPLGRQLGLCSQPQVPCNDKLIGVYDFTNENSRGKDTDGHGSHVASTAVGNRRTASIDAITTQLQIQVSGVAPHANLVSYKVCTIDDPATPDDEDGCSAAAILQALDQVPLDGTQVINYSLGSGGRDPWDRANNPISDAMLNLRGAGVVVVSSAGNGGPGRSTISSPANSPWVIGVANITHDRRFTNSLEMLAGGNATPPGDLDGVGVTAGFGPARIVHARDFGNALCGAGNAELQSTCDAHTGASNPFPAGTFDGEIVVCDRGTYGRVEKGFNVRAAGAGGYVLANTVEQGESIVGDDHCLPGVHLGATDGDRLRDWLGAGGNGLTGRISGQVQEFSAAFGDRVSASSSRGPGAGADGVMKPDLAAPGTDILAAGLEGSASAFLSGTSMASPHVAGLAALMIASGRATTPDQVHSLLVMSAVNDGMLDDDGVSAAALDDVGGGRARADRAVAGGLYLPLSSVDLRAADPGTGGDPGALNLPGLLDDACFQTCRFDRTVADLQGGGNWTARIEGPTGIGGIVTPTDFTLSAGGSQGLAIELDVSNPLLTGRQVEGAVVLDDGAQTLRLPFSVFADPGELPNDLVIVANADRGSVLVDFDRTADLPDAGFDAIGLARPTLDQASLIEDATNDDPYDNLSQGVFFRLVTVDVDGSLLMAETVPQNNNDLDLFVGRDLDGDGPEESEELCRSTSPTSSERCVVRRADAGVYWVLVQNWRSQNFSDVSRVRMVAIDGGPTTQLVATGPGRIAEGERFRARVSWDRGAMKSGERWYGAVIPKPLRTLPGSELGRILVELRKTSAAVGDPNDPTLDRLPAYALAEGESAAFSLAAGEGHGRLFIDVAEGADALSVELQSSGEVDLYLVREAAQFAAPDVARVSGLASPLASDTTAGGNHRIDLSGPIAPGRYYVVPVNTEATTELRVTVSVSMTGTPGSIEPTAGLWFNPSRNGAGFNLNVGAGQLVLEWYTYLEDGTPIWYLAQGAFPQAGNQWHGDLLQFAWNGESAAPVVVGEAILVFASANALTFDYRLHGRSGSEPYVAIVADHGCLGVGDPVSRTGLWFQPARPGFGYSILALAAPQPSQVHINYLYDGQGFPRWVLGQGDVANDGGLVLSQFSGFCPACDFLPVSSAPVGDNLATLGSPDTGDIETSVTFLPPVPGTWFESGAVSNLTPLAGCVATPM